MAILRNDQRLKPFLSQFKISLLSVFVQTTSRLCVCFEGDLIVMEKTGHLLCYLQSNCTLPTTLNFLLYDTIPYHTIPYHTILCYALLFYAMLCYAILHHTILYYTKPYHTMLYSYYTILYSFYSHLYSLVWRQWLSDTEASWDRHPSSSVAWVLQSSMLTNKKHSYLFFVLQCLLVNSNKAVFWMFWKNGTLDVLP